MSVSPHNKNPASAGFFFDLMSLCGRAHARKFFPDMMAIKGLEDDIFDIGLFDFTHILGGKKRAAYKKSRMRALR